MPRLFWNGKINTKSGEFPAIMDLKKAADAGRPTHWRDFCAFVEAWSSCKTQNLARVANAWLRRAIWEDAGPGSAERCVSIV